MNTDSTYAITSQFRYYDSIWSCFDGESWKYYGTWLVHENYLFFNPCNEDHYSADSTNKCKYCKFPNYDFDFWDTFIPTFESRFQERRNRKKQFELNNSFVS